MCILVSETEWHNGHVENYKYSTPLLLRKDKLLWSGEPISTGIIPCDAGGYSVFDIFCSNGVMLRATKVYDTNNEKYYAYIGTANSISNGQEIIPAYWFGLIDIYENCIFLHELSMYLPQSGEIYRGKHISSIWGVW